MPVETRAPVQFQPPLRPHRPRPPARPPLRVRLRRIALFTSLLCLAVALVSYVHMLTQRSDSSLGIRTVEWMRGNGVRWLVNDVENAYYSLTAPAKGGPALKALPKQQGAQQSLSIHIPKAYRPPNIKPVISPALPGEGVWRSTFAPDSLHPPVMITSYRPLPDYPQVVAGVAWIDHTQTSVQLYPGLSEPAVTLPSRGSGEVPPQKRAKLVATFNSGFKLSDSSGGFAYGGHTYAPMTPNIATFVRYRDGGVNIISWHGGADVPPNVVYARQNLPLIVNGGRPNPNLSDGPEWGATLGNAVLVWRSAVGVDSRGNLIYAAASDQTVGSLAQVMIRAGAVRAMELDINTYWTSFISYKFPGAGGAADLLPTMDRSPQRYLTPDDRDFFAVYLK